jgi:hypothetical protein
VPPPIPPEYWIPLYGVIISSIVGWSIPNIIGWINTKKQRKNLKECDDLIGKSKKNEIEEKITRYFIDGKIKEDQRQLLKDKISEYYESVKGSKRSPF